MEKTTLYLPADLQRSLRELSRRIGRPQARLIREALEHYLAAQERPQPASIGAASDGTLDATESETWLREQWGRPMSREASPPGKARPSRSASKTGPTVGRAAGSQRPKR